VGEEVSCPWWVDLDEVSCKTIWVLVRSMADEGDGEVWLIWQGLLGYGVVSIVGCIIHGRPAGYFW
jgi:hypothetical protein